MDTPLDILVIEDDPSINEVVTAHLERQGHRCRQAFSGTEGTLLLREQRPDLAGAMRTHRSRCDGFLGAV